MPGTTHRFTIDLDIPALEFQRLYRGEAHVVRARARDGRRIQFPARALRPFVTNDGVHGTFVVSMDDEHRLAGVARVDHPEA